MSAPLQVVQTPPPEWEAEYKAWSIQLRMQQHYYKQYPQQDKKKVVKTDEDKVWSSQQWLWTMKRKLAEKLVLLVKHNHPVGSRQPGWYFPNAQHRAEETIRATAERALHQCTGPAQVFFIGNAPMAHHNQSSGTNSSRSSSSSTSSSSHSSSLPTTSTSSSQHSELSSTATTASSSNSTADGPPGDTVFFMLAQVLNDPWDVELTDTEASDYAWVTVSELPQYIKDAELIQLLQQAL
eukprot:jgi/Chrzof1/752/Cz01g27110.t1